MEFWLLAMGFGGGQLRCTHLGRVADWSSSPEVLPKPSENGA